MQIQKNGATFDVQSAPGDPCHDTHRVYFIYSAGMIKIGTARNAIRRMGEIQIGTPFKAQIICLIPGGQLTEKYMHFLFSEHRERGEWFRFGDSLKQMLQQLAPPEQLEWLAEEEADHLAWVRSEAVRLNII